MRNLDIGLAMVAARIASSETEKEQAIREKRKRKSAEGTLKVIRGEPASDASADSPGVRRSIGWTLTGRDGSVIQIKPGEFGRFPDRGKKPNPTK